MKDFYENTTACIRRYNEIANKIHCSIDETNSDEDEFIGNFCIYLAQALIKDVGFTAPARDELCKTADIINDVIR